jgi:hypothetical protein
MVESQAINEKAERADDPRKGSFAGHRGCRARSRRRHYYISKSLKAGGFQARNESYPGQRPKLHGLHQLHKLHEESDREGQQAKLHGLQQLHRLHEESYGRGNNQSYKGSISYISYMDFGPWTLRLAPHIFMSSSAL